MNNQKRKAERMKKAHPICPSRPDRFSSIHTGSRGSQQQWREWIRTATTCILGSGRELPPRGPPGPALCICRARYPRTLPRTQPRQLGVPGVSSPIPRPRARHQSSMIQQPATQAGKTNEAGHEARRGEARRGEPESQTAGDRERGGESAKWPGDGAAAISQQSRRAFRSVPRPPPPPPPPPHPPPYPPWTTDTCLPVACTWERCGSGHTQTWRPHAQRLLDYRPYPAVLAG
ncbi:hypothetical protein GGR56DRAFT_324726 [Xylariaceae sp. FL0804]|nr:hypothetical protein GGR56DRAFT_324726 [Xylariaceae sp. FL0804]